MQIVSKYGLLVARCADCRARSEKVYLLCVINSSYSLQHTNFNPLHRHIEDVHATYWWWFSFLNWPKSFCNNIFSSGYISCAIRNQLHPLILNDPIKFEDNLTVFMYKTILFLFHVKQISPPSPLRDNMSVPWSFKQHFQKMVSIFVSIPSYSCQCMFLNLCRMFANISKIYIWTLKI